ncbi:MAG: hypothetical protein GY754_32550 [bacterium]|nr:hypothetical protein [bacterium]
MSSVFLIGNIVDSGKIYGNSDPVKDIFQRIVKESSKVKTIDADITQEIQESGSPIQVFKGRYRVDSKGRFRIDYNEPGKQIVLQNEKGLYWYYPDDNMVYQAKKEGAERKVQINPLSEFKKGLEERFEVRSIGKQVYGFFVIAERFVVIDKVKGDTILIWVEKEKNIVLKKILRDKNNREIMKEVYSGYKIINDINLPTVIDVSARTDRGITRSTTYYRNIRLNKKLAKKIFYMDFPSNVERRTFDE